MLGILLHDSTRSSIFRFFHILAFLRRTSLLLCSATAQPPFRISYLYINTPLVVLNFVSKGSGTALNVKVEVEVREIGPTLVVDSSKGVT
jgi:hypothetical protein